MVLFIHSKRGGRIRHRTIEGRADEAVILGVKFGEVKVLWGTWLFAPLNIIFQVRIPRFMRRCCTHFNIVMIVMHTHIKSNPDPVWSVS